MGVFAPATCVETSQAAGHSRARVRARPAMVEMRF
jgi:hypothetical protein